ncbi:DJ-1/PfpI family protein [Lysobacter yangpyeongensis]|uniref:DJ-1/PfpI family protein n=1 Tax=Lysobacter yangpyeongensis TaxID=346182 RepID=A0ABW0SN03_9GAMM
MSVLKALTTLVLSFGLIFTATASTTAPTPDHFAPYAAPHGRARPVVAVVGHNAGTELTDFVIPYAVLQRSGAVDAFTVSLQPGAMQMRPALRLQADTDVRGFDARFPDGADYVVVPAVVRRDDAQLLAWIRAQHAKGATIVSICDGALVVANAGLLAGHRATAHWATESHRREHYPQTTWVANTRYVVDGRLASSAGISAAIPTALALLESIAGHDAALQVGAGFGVRDWSTTHDSDAFKPGAGNLWPLLKLNATNKWFHPTERLALPLTPGMDDVALALTADAFSRTGRSTAYGVAATPQVRGGSGLVWLPDSAQPADTKHRIDVIATGAALPLFDAVLAAVEHRYGRTTARGVAIDFEYAWSPAAR